MGAPFQQYDLGKALIDPDEKQRIADAQKAVVDAKLKEFNELKGVTVKPKLELPVAAPQTQSESPPGRLDPIQGLIDPDTKARIAEAKKAQIETKLKEFNEAKAAAVPSRLDQ